MVGALGFVKGLGVEGVSESQSWKASVVGGLSGIGALI